MAIFFNPQTLNPLLPIQCAYALHGYKTSRLSYSDTEFFKAEVKRNVTGVQNAVEISLHAHIFTSWY